MCLSSSKIMHQHIALMVALLSRDLLPADIMTSSSRLPLSCDAACLKFKFVYIKITGCFLKPYTFSGKEYNFVIT